LQLESVPAQGSFIPIVGRVPGGRPSSQEIENDLGHFILPLRASSEAFAVLVDGDSMRDAHILGGDYVIGDPNVEPRDLSVVIAMIDGQQTVKTLRRPQGRKWWLEPANDDFPPIHPQMEGDGVRATVVAVVRLAVDRRAPAKPWR
jgi:repressor LexA